jgi:hypothetical protein
MSKSLRTYCVEDDVPGEPPHVLLFAAGERRPGTWDVMNFDVRGFANLHPPIHVQVPFDSEPDDVIVDALQREYAGMRVTSEYMRRI